MNSTTHFHPFSKPVQDHWTKHPGGYVGNEDGGNTPQGYHHTNLQGTNNAPPGYHYMPNGTLMANSEHNLGTTNPLGKITGEQATAAIGSALVANLLISKVLLKNSWWKALDNTGVFTGLGMLGGGMFTAIHAIDDDNIPRLAAGGALIGLGLSFIGPFAKA